VAFDLSSFGLSEVLACASGVRKVATQARSMEEAATSVVRFLRHNLVDQARGDHQPIALARVYKTHPFEALEPDLQAGALELAQAEDPDALSGATCLTLLATSGLEPAWNDRRASLRHRALPLPSPAAMARFPMVAQLLADLGLEPGPVTAPDGSLLSRQERPRLGIFHVAEALGSPHVPDQDGFVVPYGIHSVLGCGSQLADGSLICLVLFSRSPIPSATAESFTTVAMAVKLAVLPFSCGPVFESDPPAPRDPSLEISLLRSEVAALEELLEIHREVVVDQAVRLEQAAQSAEDRAEALNRSRLALDTEVARKTAVLDASLDSIITIDHRGSVVELNRAAEETFGYSKEEAVGQELASLIIPPRLRAAHRAGLARYLATGQGRLVDRRVKTWAQRRDGTEFPVELAIAPVDAPGPPLFTGHLRDITARRQAEADLVASRARFAHTARVLQESLLPPGLPAIPRLELASAYRPVGGGEEPGGDFYDVFETGRDDWAIVLGDVMGKGAEAAAITALARYTVRAAAMRERQPGAVLSMLNEAINRQHPERFCTLVYARLQTRSPVRLTLASGGHPPPMLIRPDGEVTPLLAKGMLLGPFGSWEGQSIKVQLEPGALVLFYSDGLVEARGQDGIFGAQRLTSLLSQVAGQDPHSVIGAVQAALEAFSQAPSDDLAMLAVRVAHT